MQSQLAKIRAYFLINRALRKIEGDWRADWKDNSQKKYYLCYDALNDYCGISYSVGCIAMPRFMYSTEAGIKYVIDNLKSEWDILINA